MVKKGYSPEEIIGKLREAEGLLGRGSSIIEACRKLGISRQTYYRWRRIYSVRRADLDAMLATVPKGDYPLAVLSSGVWVRLSTTEKEKKLDRGLKKNRKRW